MGGIAGHRQDWLAEIGSTLGGRLAAVPAGIGLFLTWLKSGQRSVVVSHYGITIASTVADRSACRRIANS